MHHDNYNESLKNDLKTLLDLYDKASIEEKNRLLKAVLIKAEYNKRKDQREDNFSIELYPRIGR